MKIDILGQKFNKLTVIAASRDNKKHEKLYLCQCECGGQTEVTKFNLTHNRTKSCGCLVTHHSPNRKTRKIDMTGKKIGLLNVLKEDFHDKAGVYWFCKCDCGTECIVSGIDLRRGSTKSCGCLTTKNLVNINKKKRVSNKWNVDISVYKKGAKQRGIDFSLDEEEFKQLVSANCFYCGREPFIKCIGAELKETNAYKNGIDRIDSSQGYRKDNCVTCCKYCNLEKKNQDVNQFILNTKLRYEHLKSIGKL